MFENSLKMFENKCFIVPKLRFSSCGTDFHNLIDTGRRESRGAVSGVISANLNNCFAEFK